ncbi:MAG TPA: polysaccharide biosynthesis/export family protein [Terriglobia bacterium]|jgi:polysaccharide export outer membrane protein
MRFTILSALIVVLAGFMPAAYAQQHTDTNAIPHAYGDSEFRLGPDDVIEVSVYQDKELDRTVPVRPDGKISLPLIGEMLASGKTAPDLQKEIAQRLKQYIADPAVTVVVKEVNSPKVSVLGEVKNPGMYKIRDRATLLDAIAMAGGTTEYAKKNKIVVIRADSNGVPHQFKLSIDDQIKGRRVDPFYLLPYDKIIIQ